MSEYLESLKNPIWQKKRLEILSRDKFTCQVCGCLEKTLHVHHLYYVKGRMPWEYEDSSLVTLCLDCHDSEHIELKEARTCLYESFHRIGALSMDLMQIAVSIDICETSLNRISRNEFDQLSKIIKHCIRLRNSGIGFDQVINLIETSYYEKES